LAAYLSQSPGRLLDCNPHSPEPPPCRGSTARGSPLRETSPLRLEAIQMLIGRAAHGFLLCFVRQLLIRRLLLCPSFLVLFNWRYCHGFNNHHRFLWLKFFFSQYLAELLAEHQKLGPFMQVLPICNKLLSQGEIFWSALKAPCCFLQFDESILVWLLWLMSQLFICYHELGADGPNACMSVQFG
jgi:hypothetical protein